MSATDATQRGIHKYVSRYVRQLPDLTGKTVLDIPCGDGRTTQEFLAKGASVVSLDLFPEFMKVDGVSARFGDMSQRLPVDDASVDLVICQEGIEHLPNQLHILEEFNRVLRPGGEVLLTTPNYSHLRSRLSQFLFETDFWKRMPPTELDSVWFANNDHSQMYFGHLFLIGVQRLLTLSTLSGFELRENIRTDLGTTSILLGVFYPLLWLSARLTARSYRKKLRAQSDPAPVFQSRIELNTHFNTLFCKHIFWRLVKSESTADRHARLHAKLASD